MKPAFQSAFRGSSSSSSTATSSLASSSNGTVAWGQFLSPSAASNPWDASNAPTASYAAPSPTLIPTASRFAPVLSPSVYQSRDVNDSQSVNASLLTSSTSPALNLPITATESSSVHAQPASEASQPSKTAKNKTSTKPRPFFEEEFVPALPLPKQKKEDEEDDKKAREGNGKAKISSPASSSRDPSFTGFNAPPKRQGVEPEDMTPAEWNDYVSTPFASQTPYGLTVRSSHNAPKAQEASSSHSSRHAETASSSSRGGVQSSPLPAAVVPLPTAAAPSQTVSTKSKEVHLEQAASTKVDNGKEKTNPIGLSSSVVSSSTVSPAAPKDASSLSSAASSSAASSSVPKAVASSSAVSSSAAVASSSLAVASPSAPSSSGQSYTIRATTPSGEVSSTSPVATYNPGSRGGVTLRMSPNGPAEFVTFDEIRRRQAALMRKYEVMEGEEPLDEPFLPPKIPKEGPKPVVVKEEAKAKVKGDTKPVVKEEVKPKLKEDPKPVAKEVANEPRKEVPQDSKSVEKVAKDPKSVEKEVPKPAAKEVPKPAAKEAPKPAAKQDPKLKVKEEETPKGGSPKKDDKVETASAPKSTTQPNQDDSKAKISSSGTDSGMWKLDVTTVPLSQGDSARTLVFVGCPTSMKGSEVIKDLKAIGVNIPSSQNKADTWRRGSFVISFAQRKHALSCYKQLHGSPMSGSKYKYHCEVFSPPHTALAAAYDFKKKVFPFASSLPPKAAASSSSSAPAPLATQSSAPTAAPASSSSAAAHLGNAHDQPNNLSSDDSPQEKLIRLPNGEWVPEMEGVYGFGGPKQTKPAAASAYASSSQAASPARGKSTSAASAYAKPIQQGKLPSFGGPSAPAAASARTGTFSAAPAAPAASKKKAQPPASSSTAAGSPKKILAKASSSAAVPSPTPSSRSEPHSHTKSKAPTIIDGVVFEDISRSHWNYYYRVENMLVDWDDDCNICFEEFERGQAVATLMCLCKFHQKCIDDWWRTDEVKRPRDHPECPFHEGVVANAVAKGAL